MNSSTPPLRSAGAVLPSLQLATQEVFELMLACPLEISSSLPSEKGLDITSMVGLAGPVCGVLAMRCSAKSAARMASRMLGIDPENAGSEMWDAVGEICNMVAGNFKNKINGLGGCMISVPTVITGADYSLPMSSKDSVHAVFSFEGELIVLSLNVQQ